MISKIIVQTKSTDAKTSTSDEIVWLLNDKSEYFNTLDFFKTWDYSFCIKVSELVDLEQYFHLFFHKNYFFINQKPVVFSTLDIEMLDIFKKNGYPEIYHIIDQNMDVTINSYSFGNRNLVRNRKSGSAVINYVESDILFFLNYNQYLNFKNSLNTEVNNNEVLAAVFNKLSVISEENEKNTIELNWIKIQLGNYKTYLSIIKKLILEGSDFSTIRSTNKFVTLLKKIGPIRKIGKYMLKKINRK